MLDTFARRLIDPPLDAAGQRLAGHGITPNQITLAGLAVGLAATACIVAEAFSTALVLLLFSRLLDGLDGALARATRKSDYGGYLDITCDFLFYGAFPFAFVVLDPTGNGSAGAFLLTAFYFNGSSFLGYAILAEKRDMTTAAQGVKSLYYSNGILEGTETILFFVVLCLVPHLFAPLAWAFGAACFATGALRLYGAARVFSLTEDPR